MSKLDSVYRTLLHSKFFTKGWGNPENMKRLFEFRKVISNRETCRNLVPNDYPITIDKEVHYPSYSILEGHFTSPFAQHLPGVVPEEAVEARFQMLIPNQWPTRDLRPICLHLAGTGDHYFWRRRALMAKPLLKEAGIASIILENPFYGVRKPRSQVRSSLHNVSDIFVMGGCLVLESLALFHWCERQGFGPLGITGISMGGHMASIAGSNWHKPLSIVPCLSWTTASCVFTQGVMSDGIPWDLLENQYLSDQAYREEIKRMLRLPDQSEAFKAGQHFARTYPESLENVQQQLQDCLDQAELSAEAQSSSPNPEVTYHCQSLTGSNSGSSPTSQNASSSPSSLSLGTGVRTFTLDLNILPQIRANRHFTKMEAVNFMRGIMDECTHLGNFSVPVDPTLVIVVTAKNDGYVPREGIKSVQELWPGCEVRYLDTGHVAAFLFNQGDFRKAIIDSFERTAQKYYKGTLLAKETKKILKKNFADDAL